MIRKRLVIFVALLNFAILCVIGLLTYIRYDLVVKRALRLQAIGFMIPLKSLVKNMDPSLLSRNPNLFYDMLLDERWEGLAYVALLDERGRFVIHSNLRLIGKFSHSFENTKNFPLERIRRLKTGYEVYEYDDTVKVGNKNYILRVVLFTDPVKSSFYVVKVISFISFLLAFSMLPIGYGFYYVLKREEKIRSKLDELEKIAFISKIFAHEIRNPLATIKGFVEFLMEKLESNIYIEYLYVMKSEVEKIEKLIQKLVAFSYGVNASTESFDLVVFLKDLIERFSRIYPDVDFKIYSKRDNIEVKYPREKLEIVMENIISNAVEAFGDDFRGTPQVVVEVDEVPDYYLIKVVDNGVGIEEDVLKKVFDPFFTTKEKGMGLGLAIVYRFVKEMGGKIRIESVRGRGTEVTLCLPK